METSKKRKPPTSPSKLESEIRANPDELFAHLKSLETLVGSFQCAICDKDITKSVRIHCANCETFIFCLECRGTGAEVKDHKREHGYCVLDKLDFPLFEKSWTAAEELALM